MLKKFAFLILASLTVASFLKLPTKPTYSAGETTLGPWKETAEFPGNGHPYPSFARDGYYYVHTSNSRDVYYARPQADGNITSWTKAWDDHGGVHGFTAVKVDGTPYHFRNGHIARYPFKNDGTVDGDVILQESSMTESFGGRLWVWDTAVYAPLTTGKYVYHLGGFSCPGHGCPVSYTYDGEIFMSNVPIGNKFTDTGKKHPDFSAGTSPSNGPGKSVFYAPNGQADYGFIYTTRNQGNKLWKIKVNSNGSLGDWAQVKNLPDGNGNKRGDLFAINNTLFSIRGSAVYSVNLNPTNGDLGEWSDSPPDLPTQQVEVDGWGGELDGASYAVMGNNYVYVTGPHKVYYAQIISADTPQATHTPTPTASLTPTSTPLATGVPTHTPTATPPDGLCNTGYTKDFNFFVRMGEIKNLNTFNKHSSLTIKVTGPSCQSTFAKTSIKALNSSDQLPIDFTLTQPIKLRPGAYTVTIEAGPKGSNVPVIFRNLIIPETREITFLDCATRTNTNCGDFQEPQGRNTKVLYAGDSNKDKVINILDYEIYRKGVKASYNTIADYDYNGKVEYLKPITANDDLAIFIRNFGKTGE